LGGRRGPEFDGIERLIVVNQFALVQTTGFVGLPSDLGSRNDRAIERALDESEVVIIGWGVSNGFESRKEFVLEVLRRMQGKRLYKTSQHPSRGRYDGFIQPLDL